MNPAAALSLGRIAVGVASLAEPEQVAALLDPASRQGSTLMTQWFGIREIALGAVTLLTPASARRTLVLTGMLVDAGDAGTAYLGLRRGTLPAELGWALVAVAGGAALVGPLGLLGRRAKVAQPA